MAEIEDATFAITLGSTARWGYKPLPWQKTNPQNPDKKYIGSPGHFLSTGTFYLEGNTQALDIVKMPDKYFAKRRFGPLTMMRMAAQPADQCHNGLTLARQFSVESEFDIDSAGSTLQLGSRRVVDKVDVKGVNSARVHTTETYTLEDGSGSSLSGVSRMEHTIRYGDVPGILMHSEDTTVTNSFGQQQQTIVLYVTPMVTPNHLTLNNPTYHQGGKIQLYIGPPVPQGQTPAMQELEFSRTVHYLGHDQVMLADGSAMNVCKFTEMRTLTNSFGQQEESEISTTYAGNDNLLGGSVLQKTTTTSTGTEVLRLADAKLFRSDRNSKSELLMFVTPKLLR